MIDELKHRLIDAMRILVERGLTNPKGGNGSVRCGARIWITPSGIPKHRLKPDDLVEYDLLKNEFYGRLKPSIEWRAHIAFYKADENINAVLHAHPPLTMALVDSIGIGWWEETLIEAYYSLGKACLSEPHPPGSVELAESIRRCVELGARIVFVPKHGVFVGSRDIESALDSIVVLEDLAKYYVVKWIIKRLRT